VGAGPVPCSAAVPEVTLQHTVLANARTTLRILALTGVSVAVVVGLAVALISGSLVLALVVAAVVGGLAIVLVSTGAAPVVRSAVGVRPLDAPPARLVNKLEGLGATAGVDAPRLATAPIAGAHALIVGERGGAATLVVTPDLVEALDRIELEAVLARQLVLSRSGSARLHTVAAVTVGLPALSAELAGRPGVGGLARAVVVLALPLRPLAGWSRRSLARLHGSDGAFEADRTATSLTRYPPALATALEKLAAGPAPPPLTALAVVWTDAGPEGRARVADRIDALREL